MLTLVEHFPLEIFDLRTPCWIKGVAFDVIHIQRLILMEKDQTCMLRMEHERCMCNIELKFDEN